MFFFFNDTATTEIYTLSLHDALPIAFDLDAHRVLYAPGMERGLRWFAGLQFVALIAGVSLFLRHADQSSTARNALWFGVLLACQWALGAAMQEIGRAHV